MDDARRSWLVELGNHRPSAQVQPVSGVTRIDASWCIPPRRLDDHLFWLVEQGGCAGEADGRPLALGPGDLLWLQPGVPHRFEPALGPRMRVLHVRLGVGLPRHRERVLVAHAAWPARPLLEDLLAETRPGADSQLADAKLRAGFASLAITAWRLADAVGSGAGLSPPRLDRLLRFVRADPRRRRSLAACAAHLGLSPLYLSRCAALSLGLPLRTWLLQERMRLAAVRLAESRLTVAAVATELGYGDAHLFSRQFRQVMGFSPRDVRR